MYGLQELDGIFCQSFDDVAARHQASIGFSAGMSASRDGCNVLISGGVEVSVFAFFHEFFLQLLHVFSARPVFSVKGAIGVESVQCSDGFRAILKQRV